MLIIHCIKIDSLYDLYYKPDKVIIWFGCLTGEDNPNTKKDEIYNLYKVCEDDYRSDIVLYVYERKN